uniref:Hypoxanthine phosphoribosyltransferase n=1 Tax=uncultured bacterium W5-102b TaxID=1130996 RepID=H9BWL1_9BACT|nr:hypoxanthine phosphoribosyltransferase [uncultured bacterium W5-102b]
MQRSMRGTDVRPGSPKIRDLSTTRSYRGTSPPRFAHIAETECAEILEFYGVPWQYEPVTFVLETDENGHVVEAFSPDFYLPEQDLFLEITTMRQELVTRKNRKVRKLRETYPDVNVKLFYRRDIEALGQQLRSRQASDHAHPSGVDADGQARQTAPVTSPSRITQPGHHATNN